MKTMTCHQLGGPCELALRGETADEIIKAQDKHLKDVVAGGDEEHKPALKAMKSGGGIRSPGWVGTAKAQAGLPRRFPKADQRLRHEAARLAS